MVAIAPNIPRDKDNVPMQKRNKLSVQRLRAAWPLVAKQGPLSGPFSLN